jgi:hypothetical protein
MLRELSYLLSRHHSHDWDEDEYRIRQVIITQRQDVNAKLQHCRCQGHVVNLASQAFIRKYSSSPHYDPHKPESLEENAQLAACDALGRVRAAVVKVCIPPSENFVFLPFHYACIGSLLKQARRAFQANTDGVHSG